MDTTFNEIYTLFLKLTEHAYATSTINLFFRVYIGNLNFQTLDNIHLHYFCEIETNVRIPALYCLTFLNCEINKSHKSTATHINIKCTYKPIC